MAPRSKEQQEAYNIKRRAENAARKVAADAQVKAIKAERKAAKSAPVTAIKKLAKAIGKGDKALKALDALPAKATRKPSKELANAKARQAKSAKSPAKQKLLAEIKGKGKPTTFNVPELAKHPVEPKLDKAAKALAQRDKAKRAERLKEATVVAPEPIVATEGLPPQHTMARSYLRGGAPGMGKLRGKTYQATVSFTEAQMPQLVEAATFRGVSLAEMIRSAVVTHLNKGIK